MRCAKEGFWNCMKYRCIHNSWIKSVIGSIEGTLYNSLKTYRKVDKIICPSEFMNRALSFHSVLRGKTVTLHNFIDEAKDGQEVEKKNMSCILEDILRKKE